jgi:serine-type D-Ala-D-Ala carboxypeptidase
MSIDDGRRIVASAVTTGVFPAATVEVGDRTGSLWSEAFGTLTFDAVAPETRIDTPFDLASLTKAVATTSVAMELVRTGALRLEARVGDFFDDWRGADREAVTVRDLLEHASGLPARLLDPPPATRREFEHDIGAIALEYAPRTRSIYSDLGFILLGFLIADVGGQPLEKLFESVHQKADAAYLGFRLPAALRPAAAPTLPEGSDPRRGRRLVGEVHDDYAAALGGVAGHAGVFGTAPALGAFARDVLRVAIDREPLAALFTAKSAVPGSSRALGWDTMLPTSSCGARMSPRAFGHVGFTGTSLWIDPERDRYFVLLTNRACGGGTLDQMRTVRRAFHDALADV